MLGKYKKLSPEKHETVVAYMFLAPALFFFLAFVIIPISTGLITVCSIIQIRNLSLMV